MATPTRPEFPPECFTSAWTSVTGYEVGGSTTVTAMVGCPIPFRLYESPVDGDFNSKHVTDIPALPECCGPFTKAPDPDLDTLEGTNVLCPYSYGITDVEVESGTTNGQCVVTADSLSSAVEADGEFPTITQIASFNLDWDQAVLSEKYGVTEVAPTSGSSSDNDNGGSSDDSDSGPNLAAIIAPSVIGGLIFFAVLFLAVWCIQRRRSRGRKPAQHAPYQQQQQPEMQYPAPQPQQQIQYPSPGVPVASGAPTNPNPYDPGQQPQMPYPAPEAQVYSTPGAVANPNPGYDLAQHPQQQIQYPAAGAPVYPPPNAPANPDPVYEPVPVPQAYGQAPVQAPVPAQTPQVPEVEGRQNMKQELE